MVVIPLLDRGEAIGCLNLGSHFKDEGSGAERQAGRRPSPHRWGAPRLACVLRKRC